MDIIIKRNESLYSKELNELLATNNWDIQPVEKLDRCIKTSWGNVCARNGDGE